MASKIVDLSARSRYLREEPFLIHFWENTPDEYLELLRNPRQVLSSMGISIPPDCRIETTIENHDWLGERTGGFSAANGTIVCNVGGGNVARAVYRIISYAHDESAVGRYEKPLLHSPEEEESQPRGS
jgi:hypothetical protein